MRKSKFTEEQMAYALKQAELGISSATFYMYGLPVECPRQPNSPAAAACRRLRRCQRSRKVLRPSGNKTGIRSVTHSSIISSESERDSSRIDHPN
jgi:hypothetical protein